MVLEIPAADFSLQASLSSGQTFRWILDDGWYYGLLGQAVIKVRQQDDRLLYEASDSSITPERIRDYFGLDLNLTEILSSIDVDMQIHQAILDLFASAGYQSGEKDGHLQGFFHGTGHGLGLEIHEPPRIGPRPETLGSGQVVTVEPGLYYPGLGAVRLEDVVVVREQGCQNLTACPKFLEM